MTPLFELAPDEPRVRLLAQGDSRMAELIERIGSLTIEGREDPFQSLCRSLIGQQLSVKAASTICRRAEEACGGLTPEAIGFASAETLREAGVSKPKIGYLQALAQAAADGRLEFGRLAELPDEDVIAALTTIKGIGRWTAEMFLIFSLGREDVLSLGDVGVRRAARWLYGDRSLSDTTNVDLRQLSESWKPYRTIASLYLWEAVNRGLL